MIRMFARFAGGVLAAACLMIGGGQADAQERIGIELNKVEQLDAACRAYLLFENDSPVQFDDFRLDLVLFDGEGIITRRIAVDASPLRASRSVVKLFDLSDLRCDSIARILLNDISPCQDADGPREDCIDIVSLRSRAEIEFFQ